LGNGFTPHWIGSNILNNQNGWIEEEEEEEEDSEEEEEDPEEDLEEDPKEDPEESPKEDPEEDPEEEPEEGDDKEEEMEVDDEENNSEVIDLVEPLPPISQFGDTFHGGESLSTRTLLDGNFVVFAPGPKPDDLRTVHIRTSKLEKKCLRDTTPS
ncbi:hypothetical protein Tco_1257222, partial [Tanacetum coccineum]